jgi:molybdenum cofactor biosynthesis protein B
MAHIKGERAFLPVNIAIMTVSDTRRPEDDKSGQVLADRITEAGHKLAARTIVRDDVAAIQAQLRAWIADPEIDAVISTGGTGLTGRDVTPEAFMGVYEKEIEGFGELFRLVSFDKIRSSTMQSRATGGLANGTYLDPQIPARRPPQALQPGRTDAPPEGASRLELAVAARMCAHTRYLSGILNARFGA